MNILNNEYKEMIWTCVIISFVSHILRYSQNLHYFKYYDFQNT
jgi:hypothetical protein